MHVFGGFFSQKQMKSVTIASGLCHTVALTQEGLFTWGFNLDGQLGVGDYEERSKPTKVTLPSISSVSCGALFTAVVTCDGYLYCFGDNAHGQLGLGNKVKTCVPVKVPNLNGVLAVSCGFCDTLVLAKSGLYSFGKVSFLLTPEKIPFKKTNLITAICSGGDFFAVSTKNEVYTWGRNDVGQLGLGHKQSENIPKQVVGIDGKIIGISCGNSHVTCLTTKGIFVWGNCYGVRGITALQSPKKFEISLNSGEKVISVSSGINHTTATTSMKNCITWGNNEKGELGLGHKSAVLSEQRISIGNVEFLTCGGCCSHKSFAFCGDGVYTWGPNSLNQFGMDTDFRTPGKFPFSQKIIFPTKIDLNSSNFQIFLQNPQSTQYCDIEVKGVKMHKAVLCHRCPVFLEKFETIEQSRISTEIIQFLANFIYTNEFVLEPEFRLPGASFGSKPTTLQLISLLTLSKFLHFEEFYKYCCIFMLENLTENNVQDFLCECLKHGLNEIAGKNF